MPKNNPHERPDPSAIRHANTVTLNALSRILAVLVLMMLCGLGGAILDRWLGTTFWIVIGFALGMVLSVVGMLYVVRVAEVERRGATKDEDSNAGPGENG